MSFSLNAARAKLGKLVEGSLEGIKVLQRGVSPRIVQGAGRRHQGLGPGHRRPAAQGVWNPEHVDVLHNGQQSRCPDQHDADHHHVDDDRTGTGTSTTGGGGIGLERNLHKDLALLERVADSLRLQSARYRVAGSVFPAVRHGRVTVQFDPGDGWAPIASGAVAADGDYSVAVADPGSYRVLYDGVTGPEISVG